jgi:AbrB family looped-hinge helix DNA binding protein
MYIPSSETTLSSKGQVVIPRAMREAAGLYEGMKLRVSFDHGKIELKPIKTRDISELAGILHRPNMKKMTDEDIDNAIMEAVAKKHGIVNPQRSKPV